MFGDYNTAIQTYKDKLANCPPKLTYQVLLRTGVRHPTVVELRKWLELLGDLVAEHTTDLYDDVMDESVRIFQTRTDIEVDGLAGPQTFRTVNAQSCDDRLDKLIKSKEVWENIKKADGKKIIVNIPAFQTWAFEDEQWKWTQKCIVGRRDRRSARFSHIIRYADFRPYWNVPTSIFKRDKLPKILDEGVQYLEDKEIEVIDRNGNILDPNTINWEYYKNHWFPHRLRQKPGPQNALGLVKYIFPNRYSIYTHDTPTKHLFDLGIRAFSSGCIRLHEPDLMGQFLLGVSRDEIIARMNDEDKPNDIELLPKPVPIHIVYMTAWVEQDGTIRFAPDIYGLD